MKKFSLIVALLLAVPALAATWSGPTDAFPNANASAPVSLQSPKGSAQTIIGGLVVNSPYTDDNSFAATGLIVQNGDLLVPNGTLSAKGIRLPTGAVWGYVLTSDGSGNGTWQAPASVWQASANTCYGVDTDYPPSGSGLSGKSLAYVGYYGLSLIGNSANKGDPNKNICSDSNGCKIMIESRTGAYSYSQGGYLHNGAQSATYYNYYPIAFRERESNDNDFPYGTWDNITEQVVGSGIGGTSGVNGDGKADTLVYNFNGLYIYDDCPGVGYCGIKAGNTYSENSPDLLTVRDTNANAAFVVTVCDY